MDPGPTRRPGAASALASTSRGRIGGPKAARSPPARPTGASRASHRRAPVPADTVLRAQPTTALALADAETVMYGRPIRASIGVATRNGRTVAVT